MSSVPKVLSSTQPGLMLMPTHGAFVIGWLETSAEAKSVLARCGRWQDR